jgi:hypothetical protein
MVVSDEEGMKIFQAELEAGKYNSGPVEHGPHPRGKVWRGIDKEVITIGSLCIACTLAASALL